MCDIHVEGENTIELIFHLNNTKELIWWKKWSTPQLLIGHFEFGSTSEPISKSTISVLAEHDYYLGTTKLWFRCPFREENSDEYLEQLRIQQKLISEITGLIIKNKWTKKKATAEYVCPHCKCKVITERKSTTEEGLIDCANCSQSFPVESQVWN